MRGLLLVVAILLSTALSPGTAGAQSPDNPCCDPDGECRLFIIAGPLNDTYERAGQRLSSVIAENAPPGMNIDVKVIHRHDNGEDLLGSVHNLLYMLDLANRPEGALRDAPTDESDSSAAVEQLEPDELPFAKQCTLAVSQADVVGLAISGVLQNELLRTRYQLNSEYVGDFSEYREIACSDHAHPEVADLPRDQWVYSPGLLCTTPERTSAQTGVLTLSDVRAVVSLFNEPLHFILRYPLVLKELSQLSGFRVFAGPVGSGTRITTTNVLNASAVGSSGSLSTDADAAASFKSYEDAVEGIRNGTLDAFFGVADPPMTVVPVGAATGAADEFDPLLRHGEAYVASLSSADIRHLTTVFPFLYYSQIDKGTYPGQRARIKTVGVDALLVTTSRFPPSFLRTILASLVVHTDELHSPGPDDGRLPITLGFRGYEDPSAEDEESPTASEFLTSSRYEVTYHREVRDFLRFQLPSAGLSLHDWKDASFLETQKIAYHFRYFYRETEYIYALFGFAIGALLVLLGIPRTRVWIARSFNTHPFVATAIAMLIALLFAGTLTFLAEQQRSDYFSNPAEALFSVVVYLFSGFEDRSPATWWGRAGSTSILVLSPLIIALLTGVIVRGVQTQLAEGYIWFRPLRKHYVICGWNDRALGIILQLRSRQLDKQGEQHPIVVVAGEGDGVDFHSIKEQYGEFMYDVCFLKRTPTDPASLHAAQISRARAVIVLSDEEGDGQTSLVLAAVNAIHDGWTPRGVSRAKSKASKVRSDRRMPEIVVESVDDGLDSRRAVSKNMIETFIATVPFGDKCQILRAEEIKSRAFAQSARTGRAGLVSTTFELLSFSQKTNEMHIVSVSDLFGRREWAALANGNSRVPFATVARTLFDDRRRRRSPLIVVGSRDKPSAHFNVNPSVSPDATRATVGYADQLLIVAYGQPKVRWSARRPWRRRLQT